MPRLRIPTRRPYRVVLDEEGGKVNFNETFWDDAIISDDGETAFDFYVETLLAELRVSLHWISTQRKARH